MQHDQRLKRLSCGSETVNLRRVLQPWIAAMTPEGDVADFLRASGLPASLCDSLSRQLDSADTHSCSESLQVQIQKLRMRCGPSVTNYAGWSASMHACHSVRPLCSASIAFCHAQSCASIPLQFQSSIHICRWCSLRMSSKPASVPTSFSSDILPSSSRACLQSESDCMHGRNRPRVLNLQETAQALFSSHNLR